MRIARQREREKRPRRGKNLRQKGKSERKEETPLPSPTFNCLLCGSCAGSGVKVQKVKVGGGGWSFLHRKSICSIALVVTVDVIAEPCRDAQWEGGGGRGGWHWMGEVTAVPNQPELKKI